MLTDDDLKKLIAALQGHACKFPNIDHEEMDNLKRLAKVFKDIETKVVHTIGWVVVAVITGMVWMLYNHGYFVHGGK